MGEHVTVPASAAEQAQTDRAGTDRTEAGPLVTDELLVEEVSIDGMCGVY
jgi:mycofactocin precursor